MKSAVAVTKEIDDMRLAAEELAASIRGQLTLQKHRFGLLYYDYEVEGDELARYLEAELELPVMGCSAIATLDGDGYHEMEAMLMVLTDDLCEFSAALSDPLEKGTMEESAAKVYHEAASRLSTRPALIYALVPDDIGVTFDQCLEALSKASDRLPVLGGINSTTATMEKAVVFGGGFSDRRAAVLVIGGDIRPVCSIANVSRRFSDRAGTITRAKDQVIYEVDGVSFADFIASYGLDIGSIVSDPNRVFYQNYPLLVRGDDGVDFVRIIRGINPADGSADAFAGFPAEGATVALGVFEREEIRRTVETAMDELLARMAEGEKDGYRYSTVLCVSCAARHAIMNPRYDVEGGVIREKTRSGISLGGFYSHGELCPTSISEDRAQNRLHNGSIVFCAF